MAWISLASLMVLTMALAVHGKGSAKESCDAQVKELAAKLAAAQAENAALKKQQVPYLTTEVIVESLGSVRKLAFAQTSLNVDLAHVYKRANTSIEALQAASVEATGAASIHLVSAKKALLSVAETARDLHEKNVWQHTREYYQFTVDTYTKHAEPQISTAKKVYYDTVHPHVGKASETIFAGVDAASKVGRSLTPKATEWLQLASTSMSQISGGALGQQLAIMSEPRTFTVMGRVFSFTHGYLDVGLAAMQSIVFLYVLTICLSFCLKNLIWKIGIKLLGKKVFFGLTAFVVKVFYKITRIMLSIALYLIFSIVAFVFSSLLLAICSGLGVGLMHGIEKNFSAGLSVPMRLAAGLAFGFLLYLFFRCKACKKRKAKADKPKAKNGDAKAAPKKSDKKTAPSPDAKQAAAKPTKKK